MVSFSLFRPFTADGMDAAARPRAIIILAATATDAAAAVRAEAGLRAFSVKLEAATRKKHKKQSKKEREREKKQTLMQGLAEMRSFMAVCWGGEGLQKGGGEERKKGRESAEQRLKLQEWQ